MFFSRQSLLSVLPLLPSVLSAPSGDLISRSVARDLEKRDPCNQDGASYELYKDYDQNSCRAPNPSNYGDCFPLYELRWDPFKPCDIFCQQHVKYTYGQEVIMPLSICRHPFTCTITETVTKTTGHTFTVNGGFDEKLLANFKLGASYAYNWNQAKTNTQSYGVTPKEGQCGYFSFIPHLITSCGLMAHPSDETGCPRPIQHFNPTTYGCESDFVKTTSASGEERHQGVTVFVYVDCVTNAPLPCGDGTIQDPAWCSPDVALPRDVVQSFLAALPAADNSTGGGTVVQTVADPTPTVEASNVAAVPEVTAAGNIPAVSPTGAVSDISATTPAPTSILPIQTGQPPVQGTYTPGWCGIHVVQYQKNEDSGPNAGGPDYMLEVTVFDGAGKNIMIGTDSSSRFVALNGQAQDVLTQLPAFVTFTVGGVDDDPVWFGFGDQSWNGNDQEHHSDFGKYDGGSRQGDTGFSC